MATLDLNNILTQDLSKVGGLNSIGGTAHTTPSYIPTPTGGGGSWGPVSPYVPPTTVQPTIKNQFATAAEVNAANAQLNAPIQTPHQASAPTIADTLANIKNQALAIQGQIPGATGYTQPFQAPTPAEVAPNPDRVLSSAEEDAIRKAQLKMYQGQIDATNQIYDQMYNQAVTQGQGRIGSTTALGARSGILGSDFANAQTQTMQDYNNQIQQGVQAERAAKIASILGEARSSSVAEIAAKNAARAQGADALIAHWKSQQETKQTNLSNLGNALVTQGIDPNTLDEKTLNDLVKNYGVSKSDILNTYASTKASTDAATAKSALETQKTQAEIDKINADVASGRLIKVPGGDTLYNPTTGETFTAPKIPTPGVDSSTPKDIVYTDKNLPASVNADIMSVLQQGPQDGGGPITLLDLMATFPNVSSDVLQKNLDIVAQQKDVNTPSFWSNLFGGG
jgi:hypothetical protein